jgi:hypothetical protein
MSTLRSMRLPFVAAAAMLLTLLSRSSNAQITVNFDETGVATWQQPGSVPIPIQSLGNIVDPFDPNSGIKPLAYNLVAVTGAAPIDGDILLSEPVPPGGGPSDLLRFYHGLLMVYSDKDPNDIPPSLADVGIPTSFQTTNGLNLLENGPEAGPNGLFGYTPSGGQPGMFSAPVTYNFTSDPASTPEPGALALIPFAAMAMFRRRRQIM